MSYELFKIAGAVAGIGGLAVAAVVYIFREIIRKQIFPQLTKEHAYNLLNRIVTLTFIVGIVGIIAYVIINYGSQNSAPSSQGTPLATPKNENSSEKPTPSITPTNENYKPTNPQETLDKLIAKADTKPISILLDKKYNVNHKRSKSPPKQSNEISRIEIYKPPNQNVLVKVEGEVITIMVSGAGGSAMHLGVAAVRSGTIIVAGKKYEGKFIPPNFVEFPSIPCNNEIVINLTYTHSQKLERKQFLDCKNSKVNIPLTFANNNKSSF